LGFFGTLKKSGAKFLERMPGYWERVQRPLIKMQQKAKISEAKLKHDVATEVARGKWQRHTTRGTDTIESRFAHRRWSDNAHASVERETVARLARQQLSTHRAQCRHVDCRVCDGFFRSIFCAAEPRPIIGGLLALVPEQNHAKALRIARRVALFVPHWAIATALAMLTVGSLYFSQRGALWFWRGPHSGLIAALLEAVPYLGPLLSSVPAFLLAFGAGGWTPLWVAVIYLAIQELENNVISPIIMAAD